MKFWRIVRKRCAADAAGEGSRLYGGRWSSRGVRVVYASTSLALAAVETFVNLEPNLAPRDLLSIEGEIPETVEVARLESRKLGANWFKTRDESFRQLGDRWVREAKSAVLRAPSAAIPGEWNVLLNPAHPAFRRIKFRGPQPFSFDARMLR